MAEMMAVARYFTELYAARHGTDMDEMRMHKMMYFAQRESLMLCDRPLFCGTFEAWKYGPVLVEFRSEYQSGGMSSRHYGGLEEREKELVRSVFDRYDRCDSWSLSTLSHGEYSWLQTRKNLSYNPHSKEMALSAIKVDATKERLRRMGVILA